jgi:hypothetical protein
MPSDVSANLTDTGLDCSQRCWAITFKSTRFAMQRIYGRLPLWWSIPWSYSYSFCDATILPFHVDLVHRHHAARLAWSSLSTVSHLYSWMSWHCTCFSLDLPYNTPFPTARRRAWGSLVVGPCLAYMISIEITFDKSYVLL